MSKKQEQNWYHTSTSNQAQNQVLILTTITTIIKKHKTSFKFSVFFSSRTTKNKNKN